MNIVNIITAAALAVVGFGLGLLCCIILNKIPAVWLCDYDEEPSEELKSGKRFDVKKHGVILGGILALSLALVTLTNGASVRLFIMAAVCFVLALIAAADAKYTIIPDQFTLIAALLAVGFAVADQKTVQGMTSKWYESLLGAVAGGGVLIILDLFSMFVLKKDGFGFGDVKLLAALGIMFGWKYILVVMLAASLVAAVHFLILIFAGNGVIKEGKYLPMGPYLCISAVLTLMAQPWLGKMLEMYKELLEMTTLP